MSQCYVQPIKKRNRKHPKKVALVSASCLFFLQHVDFAANDAQPGLTRAAPTGSVGMSGISLIAAMMQRENMHLDGKTPGILRTRPNDRPECERRSRARILLEQRRHSLKSHLII